MVNGTNSTGWLQQGSEVAWKKAGETLLWIISHPISIPIIFFIVLIAALLYTVFQNKMDGKMATLVVSAVVFGGIFMAIVLFLLGLKMGHYPSVEEWAAGIVKGIFHGNETAQINVTNLSG